MMLVLAEPRTFFDDKRAQLNWERENRLVTCYNCVFLRIDALNSQVFYCAKNGIRLADRLNFPGTHPLPDEDCRELKW